MRLTRLGAFMFRWCRLSQYTMHGFAQGAGGAGLAQYFPEAKRLRLLGCQHSTITGREDNGQVRLQKQQLGAKLGTVHAGHGQIGNDQVKLPRLTAHRSDGFERVGLGGHDIAQPFEHLFTGL